MTQKLHENEQPSCTFTNARDAVEPLLGLDAADRADVAGDEAAASPRCGRATTTTFSGSPANASAARFAPQPVT